MRDVSTFAAMVVVASAMTEMGCREPPRSEHTSNGGSAGDATTASASTGPTGTLSGGPGSTGSEDPGATSTESGAFKFDVPGDTDAVPPGGACKKVDFLFAIDNSGSMGSRQVALANSFPGFIEAIEASVAAQDYQILVTDSDAEAAMGSLVSGCGSDGTCVDLCDACDQGEYGPGAVCVCTCPDPATECIDEAASCRDTHGAGQVQDESGADCGVAGGNRYMTQGQPNLDETFACLALVGDEGMALERPVTAAIKAITTHAGPDGCNAGFLRDDALLVVTLITDDPDGVVAASQYEDAGYLADPEGWFDAFVDAKGGQSNNVVMLGVLDPSHGSALFVDLVDRFGDRGLIGDIHEDDYSGFFAEAVGLIDTACDEFEPAG